jgi:hypothetical protein
VWRSDDELIDECNRSPLPTGSSMLLLKLAAACRLYPAAGKGGTIIAD